MKKTILVILLIFRYLCIISAQNTEVDFEVLARISILNNIWSNEKNEITKESKTTDFPTLDSLFNAKKNNNPSINYEVLLLENKYKQLKKTTGLRAMGNFTQNFEPGAEEWEVAGAYTRKYISGLDFNLLNNGLLENYYKAKLIKDQISILEIEKIPQEKRDLYSYRLNEINLQFEKSKLEILTRQFNLLNNIMPVIKELFFMKYMSKINYLKFTNNYNSCAFNIYITQNQIIDISVIDSISLKKFDNLPFFDLDITTVKLLMNNILDNKLYTTKEKIINKSDKFIYDVSLNPFFHYNVYESPAGNFSHNYYSAGINLSMPINFKKKEIVKMHEIQKFQAKNDINKKTNENNEEILLNLQKYQQKLVQYYNEKDNQLLLYEDYRKQRAGFVTDTLLFNPISAIETVLSIYNSNIRILELQNEIYEITLKVFTGLNVKNVSEIILPQNSEKSYQLFNQPKLSMYIWLKTFDTYTPSFIAEYLSYNNVETAIISINSKNKNNKSAFKLIKLCNEIGIKTEILVGDNSMLNENIKDELNTIIGNENISGVEAIHFDVEPHTLDDWKLNRQKYLDLYLKMLKDARNYCDEKNLKLAVSIPLHFPEGYLGTIFDLCDKIYLMAYEKTDVEVIKRQTAEEFGIDSEKIIVAYRAKDFSNKLKLYDFIDLSYKTLKTNKFALHDFITILNLENSVLENNK